MDKKKKCSQCDNVKPLSEFYKKTARKDGHRSECKVCEKRYYEENKVARAEYRKRYNEKNKVARAEKAKRYYEKNKEAIIEQRKRHYEKNKEAIEERNKRYYEENKPALVEYQNRYARERRATDPLYRLKCNIRCLIRNSFRDDGFNKKSKTAEILGCTFKEYYKHIEAQFTDGMSWQRMSEIHIDHRLPLSAATTEAELLALNHHRNLQPMWATENLAKADSYCPKELAAYFKKHLPT